MEEQNTDQGREDQDQGNEQQGQDQQQDQGQQQAPPPPPPPPPAGEPIAQPAGDPTSDQGKTVAIVSYLTWIGWIIAIIIHGNNKSVFGAYHLRQSLGILLTGVALGFVSWIPFLGWVVGFLGFIMLLVFWIMGLISAVNGEAKPVPILGEFYQKTFSGIN